MQPEGPRPRNSEPPDTTAPHGEIAPSVPTRTFPTTIGHLAAGYLPA